MARKSKRKVNLLPKDFRKKTAKELKDLAKYLKKHPVVRNTIIVLVIFGIFTNLRILKLGPVVLSQEKFITVIGTHASVENNQVANFVVTVSRTGTNKDEVSTQVNSAARDIVEIVKNAGVEAIDVKTTNNVVHQVENPIQPAFNNTVNAVVSNNWRASTSIEVKLRDVSKVGEFTSVVGNYTGVEIFGPNYYLDEDQVDESRMLVNAIAAAEEKAKFVARNNGKMLGKIISIEELGKSTAMPYGTILGYEAFGDNSGFAPGSTRVTKTVEVSFELR